MKILKLLLKLAILAAIGAALTGVVMMAKRSRQDEPVSFEDWPDVPSNVEA